MNDPDSFLLDLGQNKKKSIINSEVILNTRVRLVRNISRPVR